MNRAQNCEYPYFLPTSLVSTYRRQASSNVKCRFCFIDAKTSRRAAFGRDAEAEPRCALAASAMNVRTQRRPLPSPRSHRAGSPRLSRSAFRTACLYPRFERRSVTAWSSTRPNPRVCCLGATASSPTTAASSGSVCMPLPGPVASTKRSAPWPRLAMSHAMLLRT